MHPEEVTREKLLRIKILHLKLNPVRKLRFKKNKKKDKFSKTFPKLNQKNI